MHIHKHTHTHIYIYICIHLGDTVSMTYGKSGKNIYVYVPFKSVHIQTWWKMDLKLSENHGTSEKHPMAYHHVHPFFHGNVQPLPQATKRGKLKNSGMSKCFHRFMYSLVYEHFTPHESDPKTNKFCIKAVGMYTLSIHKYLKYVYMYVLSSDVYDCIWL